MRGWASTRGAWTASSTPSTRPRAAAWASACPSAARSSRVIAAASGRHRTTVRERAFRFPSPSEPTAGRAPTTLAPSGSLVQPVRSPSNEESVMVKRLLVSVVDDDDSVRESLPDLLREFGFAARAFASAEEFLASDCVGRTRCLVLDIAMPGMSGPDLQRELTRCRQEIPIVFITARADEADVPRLLEEGAVECLSKPFSDTALLGALKVALRAG